MALQGALDAFALADVLQLLGTTRKTGRLVVRSARGVGGVWLDGGAVSAVEAPGVPPGTDVVVAAVHLLRCGEGTFAFEPDEDVPAAMAAVPVDDLLAAADGHLARWEEAAERIPTPHEVVHLPTVLASDEVVVPARVWPVVLAGAQCRTVLEVADALGCSEYEATMLVADALDVGVVAIGGLVDEPGSPFEVDAPGLDEPWSSEEIGAGAGAPHHDDGLDVQAADTRDDGSGWADPGHDDTGWVDAGRVDAGRVDAGWVDAGAAGVTVTERDAAGFDAPGVGVLGGDGVADAGAVAPVSHGAPSWSADGGVWTDGAGAQWSDGTVGVAAGVDLFDAPIAAADPTATSTGRWSPPAVATPDSWSSLPPPPMTHGASAESHPARAWATPVGLEIPGDASAWDSAPAASAWDSATAAWDSAPAAWDSAPAAWDSVSTEPGWSDTTGTASSWDTGVGTAVDPVASAADEPVSLGQLTPQAARAIAAAASATTSEDLEAAIAEAIAVNDHPLSRTTLLRFLDSVRR